MPSVPGWASAVGELQRRRRQVGHVEDRDVGVGVVGDHARVVGLAVDLDGDAVGTGDHVRVGHHPVGGDHETGAFEHLLAALRDAADLDHAGAGGVDHRRRWPATGPADRSRRSASARTVSAHRAARLSPTAPRAGWAPTAASSGATASTSAITFEPCTAAARLGCGDETSAVPSSQAAVSTRTSCSATPTTESTTRSPGLRIAPRTALPSTTPAISPITTSARIRNRVTNSLVRGPLDVARRRAAPAGLRRPRRAPPRPEPAASPARLIASRRRRR